MAATRRPGIGAAGVGKEGKDAENDDVGAAVVAALTFCRRRCGYSFAQHSTRMERYTRRVHRCCSALYRPSPTFDVFSLMAQVGRWLFVVHSLAGVFTVGLVVVVAVVVLTVVARLLIAGGGFLGNSNNKSSSISSGQ